MYRFFELWENFGYYSPELKRESGIYDKAYTDIVSSSVSYYYIVGVDGTIMDDIGGEVVDVRLRNHLKFTTTARGTKGRLTDDGVRRVLLCCINNNCCK